MYASLLIFERKTFVRYYIWVTSFVEYLTNKLLMALFQPIYQMQIYIRFLCTEMTQMWIETFYSNCQGNCKSTIIWNLKFVVMLCGIWCCRITHFPQELTLLHLIDYHRNLNKKNTFYVGIYSIADHQKSRWVALTLISWGKDENVRIQRWYC